MSMSKKDFQAIATNLHFERRAIAARYPDDACGLATIGFDAAVGALIPACYEANGNFDKGRFLDWVRDGKQQKR